MKNSYKLFNTRNSDYGLLFKREAFSGMVGETIVCYTAYLLIETEGGLPAVGREATFEEIKTFYKKMTGRTDRIEFYQLLKQFTPLGLQQNLEDTEADAINRVR